MNKIAIGMVATLLMSVPLMATGEPPYVLNDYSKVDARQYCVFESRLYTRGIRIKTDTGIYTCRVPDTRQAGDASKELLSWVRETV